MSDKWKIRAALRQAFQLDKGEEYCVVGTVSSVDLTKKTCEVELLNDDADLQDVRLIANDNKGFLIIPKVGSVVICSFINDAVAYVSMFSQVDEIQLNGTNYNGLVKIVDLIQKLNNLETFANTVIAAKNAIAAAAVSSPGTPVTNATLAAFLTTITVTPLVPTTQVMLENTTVKHGNGL